MNFRLGHAAYLHYRLFCSNGGAILLIRPQTPRPTWSKFQFLSLFKVKLVTEKTRQTSGVFLFLTLVRYFFYFKLTFPVVDTYAQKRYLDENLMLISKSRTSIFRPPALSFFWYLRGVCATLMAIRCDISNIPHRHRANTGKRKNLLGLPNHISII